MKSDKNSTDYSEIPITQPFENVLEQFIADLRIPVRNFEGLLPDLQQITKQKDGEVIFSELGQAVGFANQKINLVIDYLNSRFRNDLFETENVAQEILRASTHELRQCVAPLRGHLAVFEQIELSEDQFKYDIRYIEWLGKSLIEIFNILEKNWQIWLESGDFNLEHDDDV